jgi:hypothetical protein
VAFVWRGYVSKKAIKMKKIILLLLFTSSAFAQQQVFNVQRYCIDEKPFKNGDCDQAGSEYSFVFLDIRQQNVGFFLTDIKLQYKITETVAESGYMRYQLANAQGEAAMRINAAKTKIEFLYPDKMIYLAVGKSTKGD